MSKVAEAAGVSISTVARVVNGRPGISPDTVVSVRSAIKKLGYVPPPPARWRGPKTDAVRGVRTKRVAMLMIGMDPAVTRRLSSAEVIAEYLNRYGLQLVYSPMPDPSVLPPDTSPKYLDGAILRGMEPTGAANRALRSLPCVWHMTRRSENFWADYVEPDNRLLGRLAFDYLKQRGYRQMAFMNLQPNYPAFKMRGASFLESCRNAGLKCLDLSAEGAGSIRTTA